MDVPVLAFPFASCEAIPRLFAGMAVSLLAGVLLPDLRFACDGKAFDRLERGNLVLFHCRWHHDCPGVPAIDPAPRPGRADEGKFFILVLTSLRRNRGDRGDYRATCHRQGFIWDNQGPAYSARGPAKAIISAWSFIHLTYALHYAHEYFDEYFAEPGALAYGRAWRPGFSGNRKNPGYFDFLYFSYVIGVACQTADVIITYCRRCGGWRSFTAFLAFFFNSAVLALTINIAAGLI